MSSPTATVSESIVTSPGPAEPIHQLPCGICKRQFSKYACSKCNIPYCSLPCFRSQAHAECSEAFYRKEVENDIQITPSKTQEERARMMELLKRFEEDQAEGDKSTLGFEDDEIDNDDDLANRLGSLDLDSIAPEDLWSLLTPQERTRFLKAVEDPQSELARQLLAGADLDHERIKPWWESPPPDLEVETLEAKNEQVSAMSAFPDGSSSIVYGKRPERMDIPPALIPADPSTAVHLLYNICVICIAYAYTTRRFMASPLAGLPSENRDAFEARNLMSDLVPFLADRQSDIVHSSLDGAVTDVSARLKEAPTSSLLSLLLDDTAHLLAPPRISELPSLPESNPATVNTPLILVLSDLRSLFLKGKAKEGHITRKLLFYAGRASALPSRILELLSVEVRARAERERREAIRTPMDSDSAGAALPQEALLRAKGKLVEVVEITKHV